MGAVNITYNVGQLLLCSMFQHRFKLFEFKFHFVFINVCFQKELCAATQFLTSHLKSYEQLVMSEFVVELFILYNFYFQLVTLYLQRFLVIIGLAVVIYRSTNYVYREISNSGICCQQTMVTNQAVQSGRQSRLVVSSVE